MNEKTRIAWIDVAKGICMISVIVGHLGVTEINNVVYSYHLTAFFILSGYMMKKTELNGDYLNKLFKKLMIPYFLTCLCVMLMDVLNQLYFSSTSIESVTAVISKDLIRSFMASGTYTSLGSVEIGSRIGAVWFLPALFFASIFTQSILKKFSSSMHRLVIACLLLLVAVISARFIWLPFSIQSAMFSVILLLLGYELRQRQELFRSLMNWKKCLIFLAAFLVFLRLQTTKIYYVTASMDDILLALISGICMSLVVLYCAQHMEWAKPLAWIGRNSLIYLCVHLFEMETMGRWFGSLLAKLSITDCELSRFFVKLIFITAVTGCIVFLKQYVKPSAIKQIDEKRDASVDVAKGILIVLMLIGHFSIDSNLRRIIYSFHMMAFVFFSGFFFRDNACQNMKRSIIRLLKAFGIPYAVYAILYIFAGGGIDGIQNVLFGMSYSSKLFVQWSSVGPVYFILMLFLTRLIYLIIAHYAPSMYWRHGICLAISVVGCWLGKQGYWFPWSLDCAMYSLIFCHLGYCFQRYRLLSWFKNHPATYFLLSVVWAYMIYSGSMELAVRNYGAYGMTILGAVSGTVLLYMLSDYLVRILPNWIKHLLQLAGKSTVYILIIHTVFNGYFSRLVSLRFTAGYIYHMTASILLQVFAGMAIYAIYHAIRDKLASKLHPQNRVSV
ncbi:MAG: acyltransferase family protein [Oscillospiraceae bacterium]|nr:acyltransferase family protein [Oscillospiraceae bacterium]